MCIEAIYHCTHIGGDPNHSTYRIGDRVIISKSKLLSRNFAKWDDKVDKWPLPGTHDGGYFTLDGLLFDLGAFRLVDLSEERDEKIEKILK